MFIFDVEIRDVEKEKFDFHLFSFSLVCAIIAQLLRLNIG